MTFFKRSHKGRELNHGRGEKEAERTYQRQSEFEEMAATGYGFVELTSLQQVTNTTG